MNETLPSGAATPPPPPSGDSGGARPVRPPLVRYRDGRILGGVAIGVATHLGVDVAIVRILFVVFTVVTSGLGLLAYLAGLIFIPASDERPPARSAASTTAGESGRDPMFWLGVTLLVLGALWLLGGPFGLVLLGGIGNDLLWPLVLIGFGLALWRSSDRNARTAGAMPPAAPSSTTPGSPAPSPGETPMSDPSAPSAWSPDAGTSPMTGAGGPPPPVPPTAQHGGQPEWTPPPTPPRERSLLTRLTLGIALVTVGVLWSLQVAEVGLQLGPGRIAAAALLVIGIGLLVGSAVGRGRWLILVGALLVPVVIIGELLRPVGFEQWPRFDGTSSVGEVRETPLTLDELDERYELAAGSLRLDLSELSIDEATRVEIQVGMGEVRVVLPADVTVDVQGQAAAGEVRLDEVRASGLRPQRSITRVYGDGSATLTLDIQIGFGEIRVQPAAAPGAFDLGASLSGPVTRQADDLMTLALR